MNDSFELPSLEQIEEMDRQQLQAIQALETSASSVKCPASKVCYFVSECIGNSLAQSQLE